MIAGRPGITMRDVIMDLLPERRDEIFIALLNRATRMNPRLSSVAGIIKVLGDVEGPTFIASMRVKAGDPNLDYAFIDQCQRLGVDDKLIARFLLRA